MNGNQLDQAAPAAEASRTNREINRLRVRRCDVNELFIVRLLSESYGGLFTHFFRSRSHLCLGDDCPPAIHKIDTNWKGYCAAEIFLEKERVWRPICLEISEHAELDMRGLFARGQLWQFARPAEPHKKNPPIHASLLEERDPAKFPPAFDYKPVLQTLYHCIHIDLDNKNPLPPRVFLYDSSDDAPEVMKPKLEMQKMDQEEYERKMREAMEKQKKAAERFRNRQS